MCLPITMAAIDGSWQSRRKLHRSPCMIFAYRQRDRPAFLKLIIPVRGDTNRGFLFVPTPRPQKKKASVNGGLILSKPNLLRINCSHSSGNTSHQLQGCRNQCGNSYYRGWCRRCGKCSWYQPGDSLPVHPPR